MPHFHNETIQDAELDAVVAEAGSGAIGRGYNGDEPAAGAEVDGGNTLIYQVTFPNPLGTVTGGVLTVGTIAGEDAALASGTPTFIDIYKSDGTTLVARYATPTFPPCTEDETVDITGMTITSGNKG